MMNAKDEIQAVQMAVASNAPSKARGNIAIRKALNLLGTSREIVRGGYWDSVSAVARKMLCGLVFKDEGMGERELRELNPEQKYMLNRRAHQLIKELEVIARATQTSYVPTPKLQAVLPHEWNGIVAMRDAVVE